MGEVPSLWNYCLLNIEKRQRRKREEREEIKELSWGLLIPPIPWYKYLCEKKTVPRRTLARALLEPCCPQHSHSFGYRGTGWTFPSAQKESAKGPPETSSSSAFSRLLGCPLFRGEILTQERGCPRSGAEGLFNVRRVFIFSSHTTLLPSDL